MLRIFGIFITLFLCIITMQKGAVALGTLEECKTALATMCNENLQSYTSIPRTQEIATRLNYDLTSTMVAFFKNNPDCCNDEFNYSSVIFAVGNRSITLQINKEEYCETGHDPFANMNNPATGIYGLLITENSWWAPATSIVGGIVGGLIAVFAGPPGWVASTAVVIGGTAAGGAAGTFVNDLGDIGKYDSDQDINRTRLWNSYWDGCFHIRGHTRRPNNGTDLLTMRVLRPTMGGSKRYFVNDENFNLVYVEGEDAPLFLTQEQADKIRVLLPSIADKGACDWHVWNVDAYIVQFLINTMNDDGTFNYTIRTASQAIRLDD